MCVCVVSSIRSSILHPPYWTPEDRPCEVLYLTHDAAAVTLSVESEGKQTGGLYAVSPVLPTIERVCPADLSSDLSDVALTIETGRVRVSRWCVVHVVLSCYPGQKTRQLCINCRIVGFLAHG